jgi:AcrR family transcriptional regulator
MTDSVTPTLNRRQAAKAATADRVLRAARGHFETVGYEQATIRTIAKAAGMSTGAVFANYADKAELYLQAMGHPPVTPEIGRQALRALQAFVAVDQLDESSGTPTMEKALVFAGDVLTLAKFPAAAIRTDLDPEAALQALLEQRP